MANLRNAKRLSNALKNGTDKADLQRIAEILNYASTEELEKDVQSLDEVLREWQSMDTHE